MPTSVQEEDRSQEKERAREERAEVSGSGIDEDELGQSESNQHKRDGSSLGTEAGKSESSTRKRAIGKITPPVRGRPRQQQEGDFDPQLEATRAYNRDNAARARKRHKDYVATLEAQLEENRSKLDEQERENAVLTAQVAVLREQNQVLLLKHRETASAATAETAAQHTPVLQTQPQHQEVQPQDSAAIFATASQDVPLLQSQPQHQPQQVQPQSSSLIAQNEALAHQSALAASAGSAANSQQQTVSLPAVGTVNTQQQPQQVAEQQTQQQTQQTQQQLILLQYLLRFTQG